MVRYNFVDLQNRQQVELTMFDKSKAVSKTVRIVNKSGRITTIIVYVWNAMKLITASDYTRYVGAL